MSDAQDYKNDYSDESFWKKVYDFAKAAGQDLIFLALKLYYALQRPDIPVWAKSVIIGALGYFISPIDVIPDVTPFVGYADDLGVLTMAAATVAVYIDDGVIVKAEEQMKRWFSGFNNSNKAS